MSEQETLPVKCRQCGSEHQMDERDYEGAYTTCPDCGNEGWLPNRE